MADAGPVSEQNLAVASPDYAGPVYEQSLATLPTKFAGPVSEQGLAALATGLEPGILRRVAGKPYPQPGGVKVQVDGVQQAGPQDTHSLDETLGVAYTIADNSGNDSTDVTLVTSGMQVLSETIGVDLTAVAVTPLYTVPGGMTLIVEAVVLRCVQASGVTVEAAAGVGSNAGADNVFGSQYLTGLDAAGLYYLFPPGGAQVELTAAQVLSFGVDVAAVATTLVVEIDLIGRLF